MDCAQYREALSARLDGEPLGLPDGALDRHLSTCAGCTAWAAAATRATRLVRLAPAPDVPDLSARILAAAGVDESGRRPVPVGRRAGLSRWLGRRVTGGLRVALALVGLAQAAIGWPALALGMDTMQAPMHVAHESGAWNLALAVALLVVARRPRYAPGLLPLLAAFVAVLTVVTLPDVVAGYVPASRLAGHLLFVGALALVALLSRQVRRPELSPLGERDRPDSDRYGDPEEPAQARPWPVVGGNRGVPITAVPASRKVVA
ncbi:MAG TPA: zf-HC2 domain-containing protein [Mycobacteriales bacterium]|nr:zf-HC2 domain-containing protein [Mycobacteriales bacterium]